MTNANPSDTTVPNHHAHHPGFSGPSGLVAALSMTLGRDGDARLAAELVDLKPGDDVIDIGCGPGAAVRYAAKRGAKAIGIDPAPIMLRVARLVPGNTQGAHFRKGRAEALPLPDASASVVWTLASVHHWPDVDGGLAEVRRVLRPGGRFVAIERHTTPGATGLASHGWTDEQALAMLERCRSAGFDDLRIERRKTRVRAVLAVVGRAGG